MPRSAMKEIRVPVSRLFAVLLVAFIVVSQGVWDEKYPLVSTALFSAGIVLVALATLGRMWCSLYIAGWKRQTLVTEGPYSLSRNPLYLFSLLGAIGVGFATETFTIAAILAVAFGIFYPVTIGNEERKLRGLHGEKYEAYMKDVPRFFPRLSGLKEPETYMVNPIAFRKHMFSALWFIWLVGIFEIIEALHEMTVIPVLFKIY